MDLTESENDLEMWKMRCKELEETLRNMTSIGASTEEMDDTFEAVIRSEFEMMIKNYEKKVKGLNENVTYYKSETYRRVSEKDLAMDKLKTENDNLSSRMM